VSSPVRPFLFGLVLLAIALESPLAAQEPAASPGGTFELQALRGPKADVAALLLGGRESGSLRTTALAIAGCPSVSSPARVDLHVEIEAGSLLEAVESRAEGELPASIRLELYAYAVSASGSIAATVNQWVRLPILELTARPGGGVKLATTIDVQPGEYQLRVLVREARSQQFALRLVGLVIPTVEEDKPTLAPPSFSERSESWLVARERSATGEPPPSALPVFSSGQPRGLTLTGCRLAGASLTARLLNKDRTPVPGVAVRLDATASAQRADTVAAVVGLPAVEPGLYLLEIAATAPAGQSTAALPVFVLADAGSSARLAWTALDQPQAGSTARTTASAPAPRSGPSSGKAAKPAEAFAAEYLRVLDILSLGQLEEAVTRLQELEAKPFADDKEQRSRRWLTEGEDRVTRQLLEEDPECLLPLLMLHLELQHRYIGGGGADHEAQHATRTRIRGLAQVYAREAKFEMAPALAARSLVEMSEELEASGLLVSSLVVLREALILDPTNPRAILDLAYQYEHHGFAQESVGMLQRLLELEPRSDEGRLRLALAYLHSEREHEAETLLSALLADSSTDWVEAVAYEELGRLLIRRERFAEAVHLLRAGVARLPKVQRLYLELAYVLDRTGQRAASRDVIASLPSDGGAPSPRLLYRVRPRGDDQGSRSELLRHGMARLPQLAAALARIGGAG
jgi:tetratricopeptide (TPR) repeat protein